MVTADPVVVHSCRAWLPISVNHRSAPAALTAEGFAPTPDKEMDTDALGGVKVGVTVGVEVIVGVLVAVAVDVIVGLWVGVPVGVELAVMVGVAVTVGVGL